MKYLIIKQLLLVSEYLHLKFIIMKKILLSFIVVAVISASYQLFTEQGQYEAYANETGSTGGYSSSMGDGQSCFYCHTGSTPNTGGGSAIIVSTGLTNGYVPGQTYTINVVITNTASTKIGFETSVEETTNDTKAGTILVTDASRTKLTNNNNAITHQLAGTAAISGANSWQFDWVAPVAGTGEVTFYAGFNASNANFHPLGDLIYTTSYTVQEDVSSSINTIFNNEMISVFPNPFNNIIKINSSEVVNKIELYSVDGKLVYYSINENDINTSQLSSGVYFIHVSTEDNKFVNKLIKE